MIPHDNERDLKEIPDNIKESLDIRPVKWIDEVLEIALRHMPNPLSDEEVEQDELKAADDARKSDEDRVSTH